MGEQKYKPWNKGFELDEGGKWRTLFSGGWGAWCWTTADGAPVSAIVSPVFVNGSIYLTTCEGRAKTNRLLKDPRCSLTMHTGTGSVTIVGTVKFDKRPEITMMFLKALEERVFGENHDAAWTHTKHMFSPDRWICKLIPEKYITFDEERFLAG